MLINKLLTSVKKQIKEILNINFSTSSQVPEINQIQLIFLMNQKSFLIITIQMLFKFMNIYAY